MGKEILISLDDSLHAKYTLKYCSSLAAKADSLKFVLTNVQAAVSQFLIDECRKNVKLRAELKQVLAQNRKKSEGLLNGYKEMLIQAGMSEEHIACKSLPRDLGIAKDVLKCGEAGNYDAIAIGRRGISGLQELFVGSVTSSIIQHCTYLPIWLVGGDVVFKNVLVPVDGSENSLKAIDHLAFILGGTDTVKVTLFHVQPRFGDVCEVDFSPAAVEAIETEMLKNDQQCLDSFYPKALKKFDALGVPRSCIATKTQKSLAGPKGAILNEISEGNYDTIVLGRKGMGKSFFTGSVSSYLLNKVTDRVLWVVP